MKSTELNAKHDVNNVAGLDMDFPVPERRSNQLNVETVIGNSTTKNVMKPTKQRPVIFTIVVKANVNWTTLLNTGMFVEKNIVLLAGSIMIPRGHVSFNL